MSLYFHAKVREWRSTFFGMVCLVVCFTLAGPSQTPPSAPGERPPAPRIPELTLRECVRMAIEQNPDVLLARLDQQEAEARVGRTADPLSLKLGVGSGLAYTSGFPMNVGGSGPSLVNAQASLTLFDRSLRYRVAEAKERSRAESLSVEQKQSAITLEVIRLYLDAEALSLARESVLAEIGALDRVAAIRTSQESEGRVLPLEKKRAQVAVASARHRLRETESSLVGAQQRLGFVLGMDFGTAVPIAREQRPQPELPASPEVAASAAVNESPEVKQLQIHLSANQFRNKAAGASRWPIVRLVSQYSMFTRFNNYDDYYNRFDRHNGQVGASFELPLFAGSANRAERSESTIEGERLRINLETARRRVALQAAEAFRLAQDARAFHELSGLELELARENVTVILARVNSGKAPLEDLEQARSEENRKWAEYYRSRASAEKSIFDLLYKTGDLVAWFR